jgi:protein SCO1/2
MNKNVKTALVVALIPVMFFVWFFGQAVWRSMQFQPQWVKLYPERTQLPEATLTDSHGKPLSLTDLKGKWVIAFFGFTHCPDICPMTLADLARVYKQLPEQIKKQWRVLFVSVDPERDNPERLANYIRFFHPDFLAATAPHDVLRPLTKSLGAIYFVEKNQENYDVQHSGKLFIIDPQGRRAGLFDIRRPPPERIVPMDELVHDLTGLVTQ